jgi:hypothetical protein
VDILARITMKNVAKYDNYRDMQNT